MTKLEFEKMTELTKELKHYNNIIQSLEQAHNTILVSKFSDGSDMNRYSLNENETKEILNIFIKKKDKVVLQLEELGYYD